VHISAKTIECFRFNAAYLLLTFIIQTHQDKNDHTTTYIS